MFYYLQQKVLALIIENSRSLLDPWEHVGSVPEPINYLEFCSSGWKQKISESIL